MARAAWWRAAGRLARVLAASLPYLPGPSPSAVALMAACAERPQGWGKAAGEDLLASAAVVQWPPPEVEHLAGFVPLSTAWAHPPLGLGLGRNNRDGGGEPPQQSATLRALLLLVWLRRMAIQVNSAMMRCAHFGTCTAPSSTCSLPTLGRSVPPASVSICFAAFKSSGLHSSSFKLCSVRCILAQSGGGSG